MWSPDEYATRAGPNLERDGFFESEIGRTTEQFGHIMHVFSTYDSKRTLQDAKPFSRGINSIQLLRGEDGLWTIVAMVWDNERPGLAIQPF